jgi:hypothetical protein
MPGLLHVIKTKLLSRRLSCGDLPILEDLMLEIVGHLANYDRVALLMVVCSRFRQLPLK